MKRLRALLSVTRLRRAPLPIAFTLCALALISAFQLVALWAQRRRTLLFGVALCALGLLFASQFVALWTYRLDYPIDDDWRYYRSGYRLPGVLSLKWLFHPAADTVHASGKLTDWLFLRLVSHDYRHLAAASFLACFGGWLLCTIIFCFHTTRNRPALLAASLMTLVLPLAGMPYWTSVSPLQWLEPVVAYHQMLPVLGLMLLALLCRVNRGVRSSAWKLILAALLTAFFSLSYASGAFALVLFGAIAVALPFIAKWRSDELTRVARLGGVIFATAALCLVLHILLPYLTHGANPALDAREHDLTTPLESRFWWFILALFDRAVLSTTMGWGPQLRGAAIALLFFIPSAGLSVLLARGRLRPQVRGSAVVLVALFVAVSGYCALVSYGRADFGGYYFLELHSEMARATLYANTRFFYWWICATLPLIVVAWGLIAEQLWSRRFASLLVLAMAFLLLYPKEQRQGYTYFRHWNYSALYQRDSVELRDLIKRDVTRSRGASMASMRRRKWGQLPAKIRNPHYRFYEKFETYKKRKPAYERARKLGAAFVGRWRLR